MYVTKQIFFILFTVIVSYPFLSISQTPISCGDSMSGTIEFSDELGHDFLFHNDDDDGVQVVVETCGSNFDTTLIVFDGSDEGQAQKNGQSEEAADSDACPVPTDNCGFCFGEPGSDQEQLTFSSMDAGDYLIRVNKQPGADGGDYTLSIYCADWISCDDPKMGTIETSEEKLFLFNNIEGGSSFAVETCGSTMDTWMIVYDGPDNFSDQKNYQAEEAQATPGCLLYTNNCGLCSGVSGLQEHLTFSDVEAGHYLIEVMGSGGVGGDYKLTVVCTPPGTVGGGTIGGGFVGKVPTTASPSTSSPTTSSPSTFSPTSSPSTSSPTTSSPSTSSPTTSSPSTSSPTFIPSQSPTSSPSLSPTSSPSTANPTSTPSASPTTSNPSSSPSASPTFSPTASPETDSPTSSPSTSSPTTSSPSTSSPTTSSPSTSSPTSIPSQSPSFSPTSSPSTANPTSSPSLSPTTSSPSSSPSAFPTKMPSLNPTSSPSTANPTSSPSASPKTSNPSSSPTESPTFSPTSSPVTKSPTLSSSDDDSTNDFDDSSPLSFSVEVNFTVPTNARPLQLRRRRLAVDTASLILDPFQVFRLTATITVHDEDGEFDADYRCQECFQWFISECNSDDAYNEVNIGVINNRMTSTGDDTRIQSTLKIDSIRTTANNLCVDPSAKMQHLLQPKCRYLFKIIITDRKEEHSFENEFEHYFYANSPPSNNQSDSCSILSSPPWTALDTINMNCTGWTDPNGDDGLIEYNLMMKTNGFHSTLHWESDPSAVSGVFPARSTDFMYLIRDEDGMIECDGLQQEIIEVNPTQTVEELLAAVDEVSIPNLNAIATVTKEMYQNGNISLEIAQQITKKAILRVLNETNQDKASDVLSSIWVLIELTDERDFFTLLEAELVLDQLVGPLEDQMIEFMRGTEGRTVGLQLVESLCPLMANLVDRLESVWAPRDTTTDGTWWERQNAVAQRVEVSVSKLLEVSLFGAVNGETARCQQKDIDVIAMVIDNTDNGSINLDANHWMTVPIHLLNSSCVVTFGTSQRDVYIPINANDTTSDMMLKYTVSIHVNCKEDSDGKRRRLSEADRCHPWVFEVPLSDPTDDKEVEPWEERNIPNCGSWNKQGYWDATGVWASRGKKGTLQCSSTHLSTFSAASRSFIPKTNVADEWTLRSFNLDNIIKYPTVPITILALFILSFFICIEIPDRGNRPLLAMENSIFERYHRENADLPMNNRPKELMEIQYIESYMPNKEKMGQGACAIVNRSFAALKSLFKLQWKLFGLDFKNGHSICSVFQRSAGTNFTSKQRIACFFLYLSTVMGSTALFYGQRQQQWAAHAVSFLVSLFSSAPEALIRRMFRKSRSKLMRSDQLRLQSIEVNEAHRGVYTGNSVLEQRMSYIFEDGSKAAARDVYRIHQASSQSDKIQMMNSIRMLLLSKMYPYPHWVKNVAWILLLIGSAAGIFSAILFGLQFDLSYDFRVIRKRDECWENNLKEVLNEEYSDFYVKEKNLQLVFKAAFAENIRDSSSWLLSLLESLVLSLVFTQPLSIYIMTWIKLIAFTNNLELDDGIGNLLKLFNVLFCGCFRSQHQEEHDVEGVVEEENLNVSATGAPGRKLDIYGFYGNLNLFVNDEEVQTESRQQLMAKARLLGKDLMRQQRGLLVPSSSEEPGSPELSISSTMDEMEDISKGIMVDDHIQMDEEKGNDDVSRDRNLLRRSRQLTGISIDTIANAIESNHSHQESTIPESDERVSSGVDRERIGYHKARILWTYLLAQNESERKDD